MIKKNLLFKKLKFNIQYYLWATYRRRMIDKLLEMNKKYYKGEVLDIGGRDRGIFIKPKDKVTNWIFADIEKKHSPDIVLNVCNMKMIKNKSIDVINAIELFEHVENIEQALKECYRVLKNNGIMIISIPFLFPIHSDPKDFQRWTEDKWKNKLKCMGWRTEKIEIMGRFFTVIAEMIKIFIKTFPRLFKIFLYLFFPLLDLLVKIDDCKFIQNHPRLGKFHGGYFIVSRK